MLQGFDEDYEEMKEEKNPWEKLSAMQKRAVTYYLNNGFNKSKAAKAAGSKRTDMFNRITVKDAISYLLEKEGITPEKIKIEIAKIAFATDLADFCDLIENSASLKELKEAGENTALIKKIKITRKMRDDKVVKQNISIELHDKLSALEKLGKMCAMFTDNVNHNASDSFAEAMLMVHKDQQKRRRGAQTRIERNKLGLINAEEV